MNENYMMINGNRIPFTDKQISQIKRIFQSSNSSINTEENTTKPAVTTNSAKSPFDRVACGEVYYSIDKSLSVLEIHEDSDGYDNLAYSVVNYCADKDLIQQQAYRETLNRLLWKFTYQNDWNEDLWNDMTKLKFHIYYDYEESSWKCDTTTSIKRVSEVYFVSQAVAEKAIRSIIIPFLEKHNITEFNNSSCKGESI